MTILRQISVLLLPVFLLILPACGGDESVDANYYSIDMALVHTAGANRVNQVVVGALVNAERDFRISDGDPPSLYHISAEEIDAHIEALKTNMATKNPQADFWEQVQATGHTEATYRVEAANVMMIDRLLFPSDPSKWRDDQLADIFQKDAPNSMYENMVTGTRLAFEESWDKGERFVVDEAMMQMILRPYFMRWLWERAEIKYPFDGLPDGVALRINERDFTATSLLADMDLLIGPVEEDRANRFIALMSAAGSKLSAMGVLISPQEAMDRIAEEKKEYENSPISYEMVALQFLGYPSMEAFHKVYRLKQSFRDSLLDENGNYPDEALVANTERRLRFLGDGKADCEVILFSARSMETGRYAMEGDPFGEAAERAKAAAQELADGAKWAETLMKYSDLPESVLGAPPAAPKPNRGRFGIQRFNPLKEFLGENEYTEFLYGVSVAEQIFFDAEPHKIYGPLSGCTGSYIYKLNKFEEPMKEMDPENDVRHKYLVESDYLNVEFMKFLAGLELD